MITATAACAKVNPEKLPIALAGYSTSNEAAAIESDLEVNVLYLTGATKSVLLISIDTLFVTKGLRELVMTALGTAGFVDDQVLMFASHTHSAPAIDETKPALGRADVSYLRHLAQKVIGCVYECLEQMPVPVVIHVQQADVGIGINRRLRRPLRLSRRGLEFGRVSMGPNPHGPTDPTVSLISFIVDSSPIALIWSAACHPTALPDASLISSDWPGRVREQLRALAGVVDSRNTLPTLFLQGFSGDIRPPSGRQRWTPTEVLRRIRMGKTFSQMSWPEYEHWTSRVAEAVGEVWNSPITAVEDGQLSTRRIEERSSAFALGAESLPEVSFHRLSLGNVDIVGVSAEPVSAYAEILRKLSPTRTVIPAGCMDHVLGYWPTTAMLTESGYEVAYHCPAFGISGCRPAVETKVTAAFKSLFLRTS